MAAADDDAAAVAAVGEIVSTACGVGGCGSCPSAVVPARRAEVNDADVVDSDVWTDADADVDVVDDVAGDGDVVGGVRAGAVAGAGMSLRGGCECGWLAAVPPWVRTRCKVSNESSSSSS